jgi:hypothetical protein
MGGRKHLLSEDSKGHVRKVPMDPKNVKKQMQEERAAGRKPYVVDDDDLIKFGLMFGKGGKR